MKALRLSVLGLSLCAVLALPTSADAAKAKKPSLKGLEQIAGCAYQGLFCKRMSGYALNDAKAFPTPVPIATGVTVWGKKGGNVGTCFRPGFDVVAWTPNKNIVCLWPFR